MRNQQIYSDLATEIISGGRLNLAGSKLNLKPSLTIADLQAAAAKAMETPLKKTEVHIQYLAAWLKKATEPI